MVRILFVSSLCAVSVLGLTQSSAESATPSATDLASSDSVVNRAGDQPSRAIKYDLAQPTDSEIVDRSLLEILPATILAGEYRRETPLWHLAREAFMPTTPDNSQRGMWAWAISDMLIFLAPEEVILGTLAEKFYAYMTLRLSKPTALSRALYDLWAAHDQEKPVPSSTDLVKALARFSNVEHWKIRYPSS